MVAIALAVASSIAWGTSDFVGGLKSRRLTVLAVLATSQAVGLAIVVAVVALRGEPAPGGDFAVYAAISAVAGLTGLAALFRGLAVGTMGVVAPLSSLAVAVPVVVGIATGERPGAIQVAGLALAFCGMALAAREPGHGDERGRVAAGVPFALVAALGFGGFFIGMDRASDADALWAILVNRVTGVALLGVLLVALRPAAPGRADLPALVAIGTLDMLANTLFAVATTKGLVSVVSVVSALYPVTTVLLARIFIGERLARWQQGGVVAAFGGVALIAAG